MFVFLVVLCEVLSTYAVVNEVLSTYAVAVVNVVVLEVAKLVLS